MENTKKEIRAQKIVKVKKVANWVSKFCVSAFFSALSAKVVGSGNDKKVERYTAMVGGYLVGSMISDKVADYVCDGIDDIYAEYERIESEMSEEDAEKDVIENG